MSVVEAVARAVASTTCDTRKFSFSIAALFFQFLSRTLISTVRSWINGKSYQVNLSFTHPLAIVYFRPSHFLTALCSFFCHHLFLQFITVNRPRKVKPNQAARWQSGELVQSPLVYGLLMTLVHQFEVVSLGGIPLEAIQLIKKKAKSIQRSKSSSTKTP